MSTEAGAVVTGAATVVLGPGDPETLEPSKYLRARKSRKYMGVQDDLAVLVAGGALDHAGLSRQSLGERAGLYMAVGYIPFNAADIAPVLEASTEGGRFCMERFAAGGFQKAHPLLTFRCLPNMPAYHVSANFDVRGPYLVTYPGPGQLYFALEEARRGILDAEVDVALIMAVAHQRNFLVEHHFSRSEPPVAASELRDVAACVVLESRALAAARGAASLGALESMSISYTPFDPLTTGIAETSEFTGAEPPAGALGPAALLCAIAGAWGTPGRARRITHAVRARDGIVAESVWVPS